MGKLRAVTAAQPEAAPSNCDAKPGHSGVGTESQEAAQGNDKPPGTSQTHHPTRSGHTTFGTRDASPLDNLNVLRTVHTCGSMAKCRDLIRANVEWCRTYPKLPRPCLGNCLQPGANSWPRWEMTITSTVESSRVGCGRSISQDSYMANLPGG